MAPAALGIAALLAALANARAATIYVSSYASHAIEEYTSNGAESIFATTGSSGPGGLALDSAGNLYAAVGDTIEEFNPDGAGSVFASSGLSYPEGLAFDSAGKFLVRPCWFGQSGRFGV